MLEVLDSNHKDGLAYLKRKIFYVIELHPHNYFPSKLFKMFLVILVLINVTSVAFETDADILSSYSTYFKIVDIVSVSIFSLEYFLRIWTCTLYKNLNHKNYTHPFWGRLRFAATPYLIIDLLAFLPFFIGLLGLIFPFIAVLDLRFTKVFRILKLLRHSRSLKFFAKVIKSKLHDLLVVLELVFISLVIISILMFYIEHNAQPKVFSNVFTSMWWGIVTLTTVGYGDIYPITALGRILSGLIAMLGICVFALPTAVIVSGFSEELRKKQMPLVCPHCENEIEFSRRSLRSHFY